MKKYSAVLFDLDGTLLDTSRGILNCISFAEEAMLLPKLDDESKKRFIGPPLSESFRREYALNENDVTRAVEFYRERYRKKGMFEAEIYDGIVPLLAALREEGVKTAVATLKLGCYAEKMISFFGLSPYFQCVRGTDETGSVTKAEIIGQCIEHIGVQPCEAVLVGDSRYDRVGAQQAGVDFIGVSYGFGFKPDGKTDAQRGFILADDCRQLKKILLSGENSDNRKESDL